MANTRRQPRRYSKQLPKQKCYFCANKDSVIDYKDLKMLKKYTTERGKIKPRRVSGTCSQHQREIAKAIKRARVMALIPYSVNLPSGRIERRRRG